MNTIWIFRPHRLYYSRGPEEKNSNIDEKSYLFWFSPSYYQYEINRILAMLSCCIDNEILLHMLFVVFGPALLEHCLLEANFKPGSKFGSEFVIDRGLFKDIVLIIGIVCTDMQSV